MKLHDRTSYNSSTVAAFKSFNTLINNRLRQKIESKGLDVEEQEPSGKQLAPLALNPTRDIRCSVPPGECDESPKKCLLTFMQNHQTIPL